MSVPVNPKYPLFLREINKGNTTVGGYPVITVEDSFNIEAKPNTFYNIKNTADTEVNINFKPEEFYATGKNKHIMFTFDGWDNPENTLNLISTIGGVITPDNTKEGYTYSMLLDLSKLIPIAGIVKVYFDDNITEGNNVHAYANIFSSEIEGDLNNIHILNNNIDYLYYISLPDGNNNTITIPSIILEEVNNDNSSFKHKYKIFSYLTMSGADYMYTNEPCDIATSAFILDSTNFIEIPLVKEFNGNSKASEVNEFVFNINSPANIIFNEKIKWNNDSAPDLTKTGIYTISILDGVGCYTFVNN